MTVTLPPCPGLTLADAAGFPGRPYGEPLRPPRPARFSRAGVQVSPLWVTVLNGGYPTGPLLPPETAAQRPGG